MVLRSTRKVALKQVYILISRSSKNRTFRNLHVSALLLVYCFHVQRVLTGTAVELYVFGQHDRMFGKGKMEQILYFPSTQSKQMVT